MKKTIKKIKIIRELICKIKHKHRFVNKSGEYQVPFYKYKECILCGKIVDL